MSACAYFRTSSASNVGEDKDSLKRQRDAVYAYAAAHGWRIVREYYDAGVRGADPVMARPAFAEMLGYMLGNGARTVLVENASRFARDLVVQLTGHSFLKAKGIELLPVDAPQHFVDETPTAIMVRQILGAVSEFEKANLVAKLNGARHRKRLAGGHWCGRRPVPKRVIERARALAARGLSLRAIAAALAGQGMVGDRSGKPYAAASVRHMLRGGGDAGGDAHAELHAGASGGILPQVIEGTTA
jgi:DNA invertase Pin-like site-specific DNA recombinase